MQRTGLCSATTTVWTCKNVLQTHLPGGGSGGGGVGVSVCTTNTCMYYVEYWNNLSIAVREFEELFARRKCYSLQHHIFYVNSLYTDI